MQGCEVKSGRHRRTPIKWNAKIVESCFFALKKSCGKVCLFALENSCGIEPFSWKMYTTRSFEEIEEINIVVVLRHEVCIVVVLANFMEIALGM